MHEITSSSPQPLPSLEVDLEVYRPLLDDSLVSEEDKLLLLEALWSIMLSFAQLGWGVHPAQQAQGACGGLQRRSDSPASMDQGDPVLVPLFSCAADTPQKASTP